MGDKRANTTSKIRICDAVLTGLLRRDLRLVGYWLVANQSHQIEYHRQKIHSFKTRIGGESALEELLQCVSALPTSGDEVTNDQHGSKPADRIDTVGAEALISADWMTAFGAAPACTETSEASAAPLPAVPEAPSHPLMDVVAQHLSEQLLTFEQAGNASLGALNDRTKGSKLAHLNAAHNSYDLLQNIYAGPTFEHELLLPQKSGSSDNSCLTQSTGADQANAQAALTVTQRCLEAVELPGCATAEIASMPRWSEESIIEATEQLLRKSLTKDHQDLLGYVINMGNEMERKCLDVMAAVRTWNSWSEENLHLVPVKTINQPKAFTFRPPSKHNFAGWKIHLEDRPRQRYTKRTVQKWMTYMSSTTMGVWHSGITARNFREALDNGGLFCTIGGTRQEDQSYNILGGRRNHVTKVEALNIRCGQYEKEYEFKRYDTDLILPESIIKNPLPRVIVFESQELNLRAVMFIIRHPLEKGTTRRPAKRTKKFDTLLGGELQIEQLDRSDCSTGCPNQTISLPPSEHLSIENDEPTTEDCILPDTQSAKVGSTDGDIAIPRLKREPVDEADLYCQAHEVLEQEIGLPTHELNDQQQFVESECPYSSVLASAQWDLSEEVGSIQDNRVPVTSLYDWDVENPCAISRKLARPFENCWYIDGSANNTCRLPQSNGLNAFEDAILAASASQQVKRCRTSHAQY